MKYTIALDIGGTKMEGVLMDSRYRIKAKYRLKAPTGTRRKALADIDHLITKLKTHKIVGLGVSFPSLILPGGVISKVCKIKGLSGFGLQGYLARKHKCRAIVANDADCFALGEHVLGAAKGKRNSVGLIWGTGIGSGIVLNNELYVSSHGTATEMGHNTIDPLGPANPTGVKGDFESFAGGRNIAMNYRKAGGRNPSASTEDIFDSDEPAAKKTLDAAFMKIAILCSHIQNTLDPDMIVVGGGISRREIYKKLNALAKRYTFRPFRAHLKIVRNRLGDSSGIYGAAILVFRKSSGKF
jgi:fructokinase